MQSWKIWPDTISCAPRTDCCYPWGCHKKIPGGRMGLKVPPVAGIIQDAPTRGARSALGLSQPGLLSECILQGFCSLPQSPAQGLHNTLYCGFLEPQIPSRRGCIPDKAEDAGGCVRSILWDEEWHSAHIFNRWGGEWREGASVLQGNNQSWALSFPPVKFSPRCSCVSPPMPELSSFHLKDAAAASSCFSLVISETQFKVSSTLCTGSCWGFIAESPQSPSFPLSSYPLFSTSLSQTH